MAVVMFPDSIPPRLKQQLAFLIEADRLKQVLRRSYVGQQSRRENSAEHSWHLVLMATLLSEYAPQLNTLRVLQMLVTHDLIEIDAGDTFYFDAAANLDKAQREQKAADRIFGLLPPDQASWVRDLWDEFEAAQTPEARWAKAIDSLHPVLQNWANKGGSWQANGIRAQEVIKRKSQDLAGFPELQALALSLIQDAAEQGLIEP